MKKLFLVLLVVSCNGLFAQKVANLPTSYNLASGDTIIQKEVLNNAAWGLQVWVTNPDTTNAFISVMHSSDANIWSLYDAKMRVAISSMAQTISGTDTIYSVRFADDYWDGI